jgi:hypothetical protein
MAKYLRVTMEDGSQWDIPATIIAGDRARYYAEHDSGKKSGPEFDKIFKEEMENALEDEYEIIDWAANNMDWSDVVAYAVKVENPTKKVDFQEGWLNGEKEVIEK